MAAFRDVADKLHYQDKYGGQMEKVTKKVQKKKGENQQE